MLATPGLPDLRVFVHCGPGGSAYAVEARLQQAVKLVRDEQITLSEAVTWYTTRVGTGSPASSADAVLGSVREAVQAFASAFQAANAPETDRP